MKKNKLAESTKYYIYGTLSLVFGLAILVVSITLPLLDTKISFLGWIGFGGVVIALPILFYSFYLLKKGNFVKLNKQRNDLETEEKVIEPVKPETEDSKEN